MLIHTEALTVHLNSVKNTVFTDFIIVKIILERRIKGRWDTLQMPQTPLNRSLVFVQPSLLFSNPCFCPGFQRAFNITRGTVISTQTTSFQWWDYRVPSDLKIPFPLYGAFDPEHPESKRDWIKEEDELAPPVFKFTGSCEHSNRYPSFINSGKCIQ